MFHTHAYCLFVLQETMSNNVIARWIGITTEIECMSGILIVCFNKEFHWMLPLLHFS